MVEFAGWEMPVQYAGVAAEHLAVREGCGIFDVSHMGQAEVSGPQAEEQLQRLLTNDVAAIPPGGAQYSLLCRPDAGILDDLIAYRLEGLDSGRYLVVTNAATHERDIAWMREHGETFDAHVADRIDELAMLAVQGPAAREIVERVASGPLPERMRTSRVELAGSEVRVCGTGYTGEDGVEILLPPEAAPAVWRELVAVGAVPAGLAARDTLRLEASYPLYGNDLSTDRNPIEAGLGWACKEDTGFVGHDAVALARASGTLQTLVPLAFTERGIPRQGNAVLADGAEVGVVTSGTHSPSLGHGIGLAYVRSELAEPGREIEVDVRGKRRPARIESRPLYTSAGAGEVAAAGG